MFKSNDMFSCWVRRNVFFLRTFKHETEALVSATKNFDKSVDFAHQAIVAWNAEDFDEFDYLSDQAHDYYLAGLLDKMRAEQIGRGYYVV